MVDALLTALPAEALNSHLAILGIAGAGKTYAAKGEVEQLLELGRRVCVIDPTGVWWGLRLAADGKAPGYPVVIFGGDHADVPITGASGARLAQVVAEGAFSCVIDVLRMTTGERTRLFADFAEQLVMLNRRTLHLVIDEAHLFAPQGGSVQDIQNNRMVGAANHLVSGGRALGLRVMLLSQRPQKLHKDSLTQVSTLVAMRVISPQDRSAVKAWIGEWADADKGGEILRSLPAMPTGEGWVWSPTLDVLARAHFRAIRTFDSSRTPDPDEDLQEPVELSALPLDELRVALAAEDAPIAATTPAKRASRSEIETAEARGYERGLSEGERSEWRRWMDAALTRNQALLDDIGARLNAELLPHAEGAAHEVRIADEPAGKPESQKARKLASPAAPLATEAGLSDGAKRMLAMLKRAHHATGRPLTWSDIAILAGLNPTAGWTRKAIKSLREAGSVVETNDTVEPVEPWRGAVLPIDVVEEVIEVWVRKLGSPASRMLPNLYVAGEQSIEKACELLDLSPAAGWTRKGWKDLRSTQLSEDAGPGRVRLATILRELKAAKRS